MKEHGQSTDNRTEWSESTKNTRCSFHCHCLILGEVARPERFELPAFWFVVEKSGNPKALQVSHLQAAPPSKILPQLVHKLVHTPAEFMKRVHKPAMKRSPACRFGTTAAAIEDA
jgi:hypothetical protein